MRILTSDEAASLIGYPQDGFYVAMAEHAGDNSRILGGEFCTNGMKGMQIQAAALPRYYAETAQLVVLVIKNKRLMTVWDYKTGNALDLGPASRIMADRIADLEEGLRQLNANQDYYRQCLTALKEKHPECRESIDDVFLSIPYPNSWEKAD